VEVASNRELMGIFLPAIRADYTAIDNYRYTPGTCIITNPIIIIIMINGIINKSVFFLLHGCQLPLWIALWWC